MKVFAITTIFILFNITLFAADTTIVKLMKKVIDIQFPSTYSHFYLLDKANALTPNEINSLGIKDPKLKEFLTKDFLVSVQNDTVNINWSGYNLPKAICVDKPHVPKKGTWEKVRTSLPSVDPNTGEIMPNTGHKLDRETLEEISFVAFSKPAFSSDGKYALVATTRMQSGYQYLFKNNSGVWELVLKTGWQE